MTKNRSMRIAILVLALALLTSCFVGSTFAKYTSSAKGSSTATVAKWDIKLNGNQFAVENPTFTFNLFETINDTGNTADEEDVANQRIAPGTAGSFNFSVKNDSEVDAVYAVDFEVTNASNVPLEYSLDGSAWTKDITTLEAALTAELAGGSDAVAKTIQWRWVYEVADNGETDDVDEKAVNDKADTTLGIAGQTAAPTVVVSATLSVTQVD